jgi:hypothetical protein
VVAVTDRERQDAGLGADRARLVDQHRVRRVGQPGEVRRRGREPDADEADHAIGEHPRGGDGHHLVLGERIGRHLFLLGGQTLIWSIGPGRL